MRDGTALARAGSRKLAAARYVLNRVCLIPLSAFMVMTASFFLINLIPSDPAHALLGDFASKEEVSRVKHQLGLDRSVPIRYWRYLDDLIHGSLGHSFYDGKSVVGEIGSKLVASLELVVLGFLVAWAVGTCLGVLMALERGPVARLTRVVVSLLQAVPDFVIGLSGAVVLYFWLGLVPAPLGQLPVGVVPPRSRTGAALIDGILDGRWDVVRGAASQLVLPVLALGLANSVIFARIVATALADTLNGRSTAYARSLGVSPARVVLLGLRASLLPTIAYSGLVLAQLMGAVAIVEQVFNWQGLGQWGVQGVLRSDLPVVEGFVLVVALFSMAAYLGADIVMFLADPRVRSQRIELSETHARVRAERLVAVRDRLTFRRSRRPDTAGTELLTNPKDERADAVLRAAK